MPKRGAQRQARKQERRNQKWRKAKAKERKKESQSWRVPSGEEDEKKAKQSKAKEAKQRPKKAMSAELAELVESLDLDVDLDDDTIEEIDLSEKDLEALPLACARRI